MHTAYTPFNNKVLCTILVLYVSYTKYKATPVNVVYQLRHSRFTAYGVSVLLCSIHHQTRYGFFFSSLVSVRCFICICILLFRCSLVQCITPFGHWIRIFVFPIHIRSYWVYPNLDQHEGNYDFPSRFTLKRGSRKEFCSKKFCSSLLEIGDFCPRSFPWGRSLSMLVILPKNLVLWAKRSPVSWKKSSEQNVLWADCPVSRWSCEQKEAYE